MSCSLTYAQDNKENEAEATEDDSIVLPIEIQTTVINRVPGKQTYNQEAILNSPVGQNDIGDLLKLNPAVDFARNSELSVGTASMRPAEISIHGQNFYQNLYLIDGTDTSNDLNPADKDDVYAIPSLVQPIGGSSPQGYYIDTSLVDVIEVLDSNISARYGGFTGGVVSTELKKAEDGTHFSVDLGLRKDEWEKFHVSEEDISAADKYRGVYTPNYKKTNRGVTFSHRASETLGITLGISQRGSSFAQEYEDDTDTIKEITNDDTIINVLGNLDTKMGDTALELGFRYANRSHDGITATTYDGRFVKEHEGMGFTLHLVPAQTAENLLLKVSYDRVMDSLDSDSSYFVYHEYLEGSGIPRYSGAFGDMNSRQSRVSFSPEYEFDEKTVGNHTHQLVVGGKIRRTVSYYERPETITYEQFYCVRDDGSNGCQDQDGDGQSSRGDEYLNRRFFYREGKVEVDYRDFSVFIEDTIDMGDIDLRIGLRADRDSYLGNLNIGPRTLVSWEVPGVEGATLTLGANKYYGRSFLRTELNDAIYGWRESYLRLTRPRGREGEEIPCSIADFDDCTHLFYDDRSGNSELKSPYTNEFSIGWSQSVAGWMTRAQIVNRLARDGLRRSRVDGLYFYNNEGQSDTLSTTLSLQNEQPISVLGSETNLSLGFSYRDRTSNYQDDGGYDDEVEYELIYYNGKLIETSELPPWDYNIPFGIRAQAVTSIPRIGLKWMNFINLKTGGTIARDSRENYVDPSTGMEHDIYEDFDFDNLVTVDSRIRWDHSIQDQFGLWVLVEVRNLFDKITDYSHLESRRRYTSGRRIGVDMGITF